VVQLNLRTPSLYRNDRYISRTLLQSSSSSSKRRYLHFLQWLAYTSSIHLPAVIAFTLRLEIELWFLRQQALRVCSTIVLKESPQGNYTWYFSALCSVLLRAASSSISTNAEKAVSKSHQLLEGEERYMEKMHISYQGYEGRCRVGERSGSFESEGFTRLSESEDIDYIVLAAYW
jgi:hypothetical protein